MKKGELMEISLELKGVYEKTVNNMVKAGIANTKEEAIIIAILDYPKHHKIKS